MVRLPVIAKRYDKIASKINLRGCALCEVGVAWRRSMKLKFKLRVFRKIEGWGVGSRYTECQLSFGVMIVEYV